MAIMAPPSRDIRQSIERDIRKVSLELAYKLLRDNEYASRSSHSAPSTLYVAPAPGAPITEEQVITTATRFETYISTGH